jgi:XTP/dITP diphosphohydrolase
LIHPKKRNETVFAQITKQKEFQQQLPAYNRNSKLEDIGCYEEILETADTIEGIFYKNYVTEKYG